MKNKQNKKTKERKKKMKKLTAGIFATILGLTAMGAADAAVTSKGYVDSAVGAVKDTVTDLSTTVQGAVANINDLTTDVSNLQSADTTLQRNIDAVSQVANAAATKTELSDGLALKADKTFVGELPADATASTVVGFVEEKTANIASDATVSALDTRVSSLETASATHATKDELTTAKNELQGDINDVSAVANTASANATQALADAATAQTAAGDAKSAADAAQLTANANTQAIEGLGSTYVKIADYDVDTAAQEAINTQVNTSITNLTNDKADKTALNNEATTRKNTDDALQAASDAIESGVGGIESAGVGEDGNYALTKKVTTVDGKTTTTYVWELIDRDYVETEVTDNGK